MIRTSTTHPLLIDSFPLAQGRVGMTLLPGRQGPSQAGFTWKRDLDADIAALARWGADIVVTLTEPQEMERLGCARLPEALAAAGIECIQLPILDIGTPGPGWDAAWARISPVLHRKLEAGGSIVIHCRAGLERTAMVAALLQCERGADLGTTLGVIAAARKGAGPLPAQRRWVEARIAPGDRVTRMIRASLFGGAMGDALGAEIEFWSLGQIRARFPGGVDRILPHDGRAAAITDDTQMTLFTAEGLIRAEVRGRERGICTPQSVVHHALLRWLDTQGERGQIAIEEPVGLIGEPRLRQRRAPGLTCLSSLRASRHFGDAARNDSKGCGSIMRVAPVGLYGREQAGALADSCSALTHGHRTGRDAARAFAVILADVLAGASLDRAIERARSLDLAPETQAAITAALCAPRDGQPETVETLGGGWVAEEALAIALYAARVSHSFDEGLRIAVTHSGDSDSTGAIAGNLLGLLFPDEVLAHRWRAGVECADLIERLAIDLARTRSGQDLPDSFADRYPGW